MERSREIAALHEAALAITSERALDKVLQKIVDVARELVNARFAALGVPADDGSLKEFVTSGLGPDEIAAIGRRPRGDGLLGRLMSRSEPLRVANVTDLPGFRGFPANHPIMTSFLGAPIISHGRILGSLYLTDKIGSAEFTVEDEELLEMLAAQAAVAIDNARLFESADDALRLKVEELQTERRNLQSLLDTQAELDRLKDELISIISHELRNPLTAIRGRAQLMLRLARREAGREDDVVGLLAIDAQVGKLADMARELLDVSQMRLGLLELHRERVNLVALARQSVEQFRASDDQHTYRLETAAPSIQGEWDGVRLDQVFFNLLENAKKYSASGGEIAIHIATSPGETTAGTASCVRVAVCDNGIGIPPQAHEHVFDRFYRAANAKGRAETGLGLGLYICKEIITQHGGSMWVESAEGKGATFYFELPLQIPARI